MIKKPVAQHSKAPAFVVDASGRTIAMCGVNGDIRNSGSALAAEIVAALNAYSAPAEVKQKTTAIVREPIEALSALTEEKTPEAESAPAGTAAEIETQTNEAKE